MKKKALIIALIIVLVAGIVAASVLFPKLKYAKDSGDTEELFRQNVASVGYENTIEEAIPQTELYNIIKTHFENALPDGKTEKKAIVIGYDGCRADVLTEMVDGNSAIDALLDDGGSVKLSYCGGVNYPDPNTQDTSTAPGWCSILTGVWADKHGVTENDVTKSLEYKTLLSTLVEEKTIESSSFITRWKGHFDRDNATYNDEKAYCEENELNVAFNRCEDDAASHEFTLNEVKKSNCADFVFVIYEPTDGTGHDLGFTINNPKYKEAFKTADQYGLEVVNAIKAREAYATEDWLIIITSDHGGIGTGHGAESIQERMTFIVTNKDVAADVVIDRVVVTNPEESKGVEVEKTETPEKTEKSVLVKPTLHNSPETTLNNSPETSTEPAHAVRIEIASLPNKTTYYIGDELSFEGIRVIAYFDDGTSRDITNILSVSFDYWGREYQKNMTTPGVKTVEIEYVDSYTDLTVTYFTITVKEAPTTEPVESTEITETTTEASENTQE